MGAVTRAIRVVTPLVPLVSPVVRAFLGSALAYPAARLTGLLRARAPRDDIHEFMQALRRISPVAYWKTLLGLTEGDAWDVLARVEVPVQVIAAAHDLLVPLSDMRRMGQVAPRARWQVVEDAGHAGLVEAGQEIAQAVRDFLVEQRLEPAGAREPRRIQLDPDGRGAT